MTSDLFDEVVLRHWLSHWDSAAPPVSATTQDGLLQRLRAVLLTLRTGGEVSALDLIALMRHWMLRTGASGGAKWFRVPSTSPWPDATAWENAGFEVARMSGGLLDVRATAPRLEWLGAQSDLLDDAFACLVARQSTWVPGDPFFQSLLGQEAYTGAGQREAIRALVQSPPALTLIANLPTGSGKSLLAQLPPLRRREGFLTLVILPTVALALDQERRMHELLQQQEPHWQPRPLAYHAGLSSAQRAQIFQGVREGQQRVLFAGPEAATGILRKALLDSASEGRLTDIVIDEAHIVASWGSSFRPAFQLLPSLIRSLRKRSPPHAPIRVVLASATITQHTMEVLQQQFGGAGLTEAVSAVYLRPEPRYASAFCHSDAQREARVLEALRYAPRPFILYVTRPGEAKAWLKSLSAHGFGRVAQFTGDTRADERKTLLQRWERNELDGMVATSAFGLGVDKGDVRTVVHATLPESLDRFYQEVGRSGRDGRASASLLLYTEEDIGQAAGMRGASLIGNDIGYDRWMAMVQPAFHVQDTDEERWVNLHAVRPELKTRGPSNLRWNLRTLNLMASAGFIELVALSATDPRSSPNDTSGEVFDHELGFAAVRYLRTDHRNREVFDREMNRARDAHEATGRSAFDALLHIARGETSVESGLAKLYGLHSRTHWTPVDRLCGGCNAHWESRPRTPLTPRPVVGRLTHFDNSMTGTWPTHLPRVSPSLAIVALDDVSQALCSGTTLSALLSRLRPHTVLVPHGASDASIRAVRARVGLQPDAIFIDRFREDDPLSMQAGHLETRIVCWTGSTMTSAALSLLLSSDNSFTVLLLGRHVADPERPDRSLTSIFDCADQSELLRALTS